MSILSDREIKARCLYPTGSMQVGNWDRPYGREDTSSNAFIDTEGTRWAAQPFPFNFTPLTEEEKTTLGFQPMIAPFVDQQVRYEPPVNSDAAGLEGKKRKIISYGLSSYGYDFRVAPEFKIFTNINSALVDPLDIDERAFVHHEGECCIVPPNSFLLTRTLEYFKMPKDITGVVTSKSTYARSGLHCLTTVIEAGWEGELVLEYANMTPLPVKLYANMGGGQILFYRGLECDVPYDHTRKYQGQRGITLPKV